MATLSSLKIRIGADVSGVKSAFQDVARAVEPMAKRMKEVGRTMSTYVTLPLAGLAANSVRLFDKQAKAIAKVENGLRSTGGAAGFTSKQLQEMASSMQGVTLFGDEDILNDATAQLLTFTNIAGREFERTQRVALDLATKLDSDLKGASIQLGKALNDPVKNLSALSRAGIQFSKEQTETIKTLAEGGRMAEAQRVILTELERQYGGTAEAAAAAGTGGLKQLSNSLGDLQEEIGAIVYEGLRPLVGWVQQGVTWFQGLSKETKQVVVVAGGLAAALGPVLATLGTLSTVVLPAVVAGFTALTGPIGLTIAAVAGLGAAAYTLIADWEEWKVRFEIVWLKAQRLIERGVLAIRTKLAGLFEDIPYLGEHFGRAADTSKKRLAEINTALRGTQEELAFTKAIAAGAFDDVASEGFGDFAAMVKSGTSEIETSGDRLAGVLQHIRSIFAQARGDGGKLELNTDDAESDPASVKEKAEEGYEVPLTLRMEQPRFEALDLDFDEMLPIQPGSLDAVNEKLQVFRDRFTAAASGEARAGLAAQIAEMERLREGMIQTADGSESFAARMSAAMPQVGEVVEQGIEQAAGSFLEGVGAMMAGQATLGSVVTGVFQTLADLAIRVGKIAIAVGIGVAGIKKALQSLNPAVAIAAGVALVALGGAAKAALSSAAGGSGGGAGLTQSGVDYSVNGNDRRDPRGAQSGTGRGVDRESAGRSASEEVVHRFVFDRTTMPSGDTEYSVREENRRQDRYGTRLS